MYILDTDHLGILQRGGSVEFERLMERIAEAGDENIYLTIISFHEVISGWTKYVKNSGDQERIVAGYQRLEQILTDFASAQVLQQIVPARNNEARNSLVNIFRVLSEELEILPLTIRCANA